MAWTFDPPGGLTDFSDPEVWQKFMSGEADYIFWQLAANALRKNVADLTQADLDLIGSDLAYVHPLVEQIPANAETIAVKPWGGFPRFVDRHAPWPFAPLREDLDGSYRTVEDLGEQDYPPGQFVDEDGNALQLPVRHRQNEYLEWAVRRGKDGRLSSITFVAEGYDYFSTLFEADEQKVVDLFELYTGVRDIKADTLRALKGIWRVDLNGGRELVAKKGAYNYRNALNIDPGIVHLSHHANSLGAQIAVAGVSALARVKVDGTLVSGVDEEELLCCNRGGDPNRNSDPKISQQAYTLVQKGYRYTLANPIGLYIAGVDEQNITLPNGDLLPREWWTIVRGHDLWSNGDSRTLRLTLAPPAGETIGLEDLKVNGSALRYPGQVARLIGVHLFVTRWKRAGQGIGPKVPCLGTCCRNQGMRILVRDQHGSCPQGTTLAFPGLVPENTPTPHLGQRIHGAR